MAGQVRDMRTSVNALRPPATGSRSLPGALVAATCCGVAHAVSKPSAMNGSGKLEAACTRAFETLMWGRFQSWRSSATLLNTWALHRVKPSFAPGPHQVRANRMFMVTVLTKRGLAF
eukprot:6194367-Alexandrium_andersonii.AAC.1